MNVAPIDSPSPARAVASSPTSPSAADEGAPSREKVVAVPLSGLLADTAIYGLARVIDPILGFLILPVMTAYLAPSDYGVLSLFSATANIAFVLYSMGVHQAFLRRYTAETDPARRQQVLNSSFVLALLYWGAALGPVMLFGGPLSRWIFGVEEPWYVWVLVTAALVQVLEALANNRLQADGLPWTYFFTNVLASVFIRSLSLALVIVGYQAWGWIAGETLGRIAAVAVLGWFALRHVRLWGRTEDMKTMFRYGALLVPAMLSFYVMTATDKYLIRALCESPFEQVGLYTVGERIAGIMHMANLAFVLGWQRFAFNNMHAADGQRMIAQGLRVYIVAAGFAATALAILGDDLTHWIINERFDAGAVVIAPLTIAAFVGGLASVADIGLHKASKPASISMWNVVAAAINVALNFYAIPRWGILGAAVSTLVCQCVRLAMVWSASQNAYRIPLDYRRIGAAVAVFVVVGVLAECCRPLGWRVATPAGVGLVAAAAGCLWWTGCFTTDERSAIASAVRRVVRRLRGSSRSRP
ncbi:MAG: lipopolysaccharide biosynthesis protein [Lacipirellulaceae bacterium]